MLTDAAIRNLKPRIKPYKITDRDGMYALVSPGVSISFRYDYRLNGRRETLTIGRYGKAGTSLAMARDVLSNAKRAADIDGVHRRKSPLRNLTLTDRDQVAMRCGSQ